MRVLVSRLGMVEYDRALACQEATIERVRDGAQDTLLLLEHPAVYTLGRGADPAHLGSAGDGTIPVVRTTRGGQVTYHGPGQLVGYPVFDLRRHRMDVRWYVGALEEVLIRALGRFGIPGERRPGTPGVWTRGGKIASIGIGIRRWVTFHGFALNVDADLAPFERITPCGLAGVRMTSVALEAGGAEAGLVEAAVVQAAVDVFGFEAWTAAVEPDVAVAPEVRG